MNLNDQHKQLISAYIDGALAQEERSQVEDLFLKDQDAQRYYKELQQLSNLLPQWRDEDVSPDLAGKIQKTLLEQKIRKEGLKMKQPHFRVPMGGGIFVTIAIMVVVGLLVARPGGIYQSAYHPQVQREVYDYKGTIELKKEGVRYQPYYLESQYSVTQSGSKEVQKYAVQDQVITTDTLNSNVLNVQQEFWGGGGETSYPAQQMPSAERERSHTRATGGFQESTYPASTDVVGDQYSSGNTNIVKTMSTSSVSNETFIDGVTRSELLETDAITARRDSGILDVQQKYWGKDEARYPSQEMPSYQRQYRYPEDKDYYNDGRAKAAPNTEEYDHIYENYFTDARMSPLSTFSIDVDTASYSNVRRFLNNNQLPPVDAVRIEEMVNYFNYDYPKPSWGQPFSVTTDAAVCPWNQNHYLVRIGLQGAIPPVTNIPPSNLVFLIDVSGSMNQPDKLPLLKESFKMMAEQLRPDERVAIVVYSGSAQLWLDSTPGTQKVKIIDAIDRLYAGGATAGEAGLKLAYTIAKDNFIKNGNNRVVLATDGDFNVGVSGDYELVRLIEERRGDGVFLSVLGFGTDNLKDGKMEKIANHGNGTYYYIDTLDEGRKVLADELGSTLLAIAKDVKVQVEFNPQNVKAYKLIGYENRLLAAQDFNNDKVDAGEIGAGHTVTALYEIIPANPHLNYKGVDPLKYQAQNLFKSTDIMTVKLRYKYPKGATSKLTKKTLKANEVQRRPNGDFAFAAAVAEFGMLLRNSPLKGQASYENVLRTAHYSLGQDSDGRRREFIGLVERAISLDYRIQTSNQVDQYYNQPTIGAEEGLFIPARQFKGE